MRKKWFRALFRRRLAVITLLIVQMLFLGWLIISTSHIADWIPYALTLVSIVVVIYIVSRDENTAYKLTWIVQVLAFPIFGGLFYLLFKFQSSTKKIEELQKKAERELSLIHI